MVKRSWCTTINTFDSFAPGAYEGEKKEREKEKSRTRTPFSAKERMLKKPIFFFMRHIMIQINQLDQLNEFLLTITTRFINGLHDLNIKSSLI